MRRALPRGACEPLRGFGSAEPGVGPWAGGLVPAASGWDLPRAMQEAWGAGMGAWWLV